MATVNVTVRMDEELKKQADALFNDLGLSMTSAFTVFTKQAIREQRIPFTISRDVPNAETLAALDEVRRMKADCSLGTTYRDADSMMEDLLK